MKIKEFAWFVLVPVMSLCLSCRSVSTREVQGQDIKIADYSGMIKSQKVFPGTLSEYSYYFLQTGDGGRFILFNLSNVSQGFERFVDREVRVNGVPGTGSIGWKGVKTNGIIVKNIGE